MNAPIFGEQLPNGATAIASRLDASGDCYVLAKRGAEYASWLFVPDGSILYGHYNHDLKTATEDWQRRGTNCSVRPQIGDKINGATLMDIADADNGMWVMLLKDESQTLPYIVCNAGRHSDGLPARHGTTYDTISAAARDFEEQQQAT